VGPVGVDNVNNDKARYDLGFTYACFLQGLRVSGENIGATPTIGEEHGDIKGVWFINVDYQF